MTIATDRPHTWADWRHPTRGLSFVAETDTHIQAADQFWPMTRLWLVERSYDDRNLVSFTYGTVDGERQLRKELSMALLQKRPTTAAIEADDDELSPVDDSDQERFAAEARKMQSKHDPDDEI